MQRQTLNEYLKRRLSFVPLTVIMSVYAAFCLGAGIYFLTAGMYRDAAIALIYLLMVPLVYALEYLLKIRATMPYCVLLIVFLVFCFLGASFNFYTLIPFLDNVLHFFFGVVFFLLGIGVFKSLMGEPQSKKSFAACLLFGFAFSLLVSVFWEFYEFAGDMLIADMDMQEDTFVDHIHSFVLFPGYDHLHTEQIEGIAYTVLYDAEGNVLYTIEGGYLDIGIIDTIHDLFWCTVANAALCVLFAVDNSFGKRAYRALTPALANELEEMGCVPAPCDGEEAFADASDR
ncbi:MAG: hypothetical protein ACI4L9_01090 [Candidatus Coproplasma sp.]